MSKKKNSKTTKMHGGLIRKESRVTKDQNGHVTTQHWDGRQDVQINAQRVTVTGRGKTPGGSD